MIKFFRKIRQKMLTENKFSKYLIYAIGEIILVVIGILIALSVNNANNNRKLDDLLKDYYNQLITDLKKDIDVLNNHFKDLDSNLAKYDAYVELVNKQNVDPTELLISLANLDYTYSVVYWNSNTIETLNFTGDIRLLPVEIKNKLLDLKNEQDKLSVSSTDSFNIYLEDLLDVSKFGISPNLVNAGILNPEHEFYSYFNIEQNTSKIILMYNAAQSLKDYTERAQLYILKRIFEQVEILINLIEKELKNK